MTVCIPTFHKNAAILSSFSMKIERIELGFFLITFIISRLKDKLQLALLLDMISGQELRK